MGGGADGRELAVVGQDLAGVGIVGAAAGEGEAAYRGNAGQPFAAKAHAGHVFQVGQIADFAGGMSRQCQRYIAGSHATAVVGDAHQFDAAARQFDVDLGGAGIYAVFENFLQRIGRALHHFTGGNLVNQVVG